MKTGLEIEGDIYEMLKSSPIHLATNGEIYKGDTRPFQEKGVESKEYIVVRYLTGLSTQIQKGVVIVNAYSPYIAVVDKVLVRNTARCQELERKLDETFYYLQRQFSDYYFSFDGAIQTYGDDGIKQTFSTLRIKYKILEN